jgi:hypothetical protein
MRLAKHYKLYFFFFFLGPIIITISSSALKLQIDRKCQKENKNTFGHGFINPKKKKTIGTQPYTFK